MFQMFQQQAKEKDNFRPEESVLSSQSAKPASFNMV